MGISGYWGDHFDLEQLMWTKTVKSIQIDLRLEKIKSICIAKHAEILKPVILIE